MLTTILASAALGLSTTPLLDYVWHAVLGHGVVPNPTAPEHLAHHRTASTVTPPWDEVRANAGRVGAIALGLAGGAGFVVGHARAVPFAAGLVAGYVLITHYHAKMHARPPRTAYERWMWRFHWYHHAKDARANFGLTTPIFDFVFRTAVVPASVEIPEALAPTWLDRDMHGLSVRRRERPAAG